MSLLCTLRPRWAAPLARLLCAMVLSLMSAAAAPPVDRHFRVALYVVVHSTRALADPATFEAEYARVSRQLKFDKVYLEVYRNHAFATDAEISAVAAQFRAKGVTVAGGVTLAAGGQGGQFGTFDYEVAGDRAECRKAAELAARHFDEVILDDFFFYTTKSAADIRAKGTRSWSAYRLATMRQAAAELVVGPARRVNPHVKMVIKYPNWYEHFQGLGYDLKLEPGIFDGIYTGTETREATLTDQYLQPYQSYEIFRYFSHVRPGGNGGGWVDSYSLANVDRYVGQLWDTLFAGAPEITLFNWFDMAGRGAEPPGEPGLDLAAPGAWINPDHRAAFLARSSADGSRPGLAQAAAFAFAKIDPVLGQLGRPVGIPSYKPFPSDGPFPSGGEAYLQSVLGSIGLPIEMSSAFPDRGEPVLLTESAAADPGIVDRIKRRLMAGGSVVVTSGFLARTQDRGFRDIAEWEVTGRKVLVDRFVDGFGAGAGVALDDPARPVQLLIPEVRFYTNDSWAILRASSGPKGYPLLLANRYGSGTVFVLVVPENPVDVYRLPPRLLARLRAYLMASAPVRLEAAPAGVGLYTYDNGAFVIRSWRDEDVTVEVSQVGGARTVLREIPTGAPMSPVSSDAVRADRGPHPDAPRARFSVVVPAHGFRAFAPATEDAVARQR